MVTNSGVDFYALNRRTHKLSHVKGFMQNATHFWFHQGVLVLSCSLPRLGSFITFFLERGPKALPGPRFSLDLQTHLSEIWTARAVNSSRITEPYNSELYLHRVLLCNLYGDVVLVHANSDQCRLTLYTLTWNRVEVKDNFEPIPAGKYDIHSVDNVLLLMNLTLHESYLYDVKSTKYSTRPFCTVWNAIIPRQPEISVSIEPQEASLDFNCLILIDGRHVSADAVSIDSARSPFEHIIETAVDTNQRLVSLGPELLLDIEGGRCYRLSVDFNEVVKDHSDRLESILFLFRRSGYRVLGFEYIKQAIRHKVPLVYLSTFFETINSVYKLDSQEPPAVLTRRHTFSGNITDLHREDVKTNSGIIVLLQSDMCGSIFLPLFEQGTVEPLYFTSVVLEYFRSLVIQDIPIHLSLQMLIARLLVRSGSVVLLQELILYSTFNDSRDLAHLLLSVSKTRDREMLPCLNLAIDMLARLKLNDEVAEVLLNRGLVYEVIRMTPSEIDLNQLNCKAEETADPELIGLVQGCILKTLTSQ